MSGLGRKTTRANALAMAAMCNADSILIDVQATIDGVTPVMEIGVAGRSGGQNGAGVLTASNACFEFSVKAFQQRYGDEAETKNLLTKHHSKIECYKW